MPSPTAEELLAPGNYFPADANDPIYSVPLRTLSSREGFGRFLAAHPRQGCLKVTGLNHQWKESHHKEPYFVTFRPGSEEGHPAFSWSAERLTEPSVHSASSVFEVGEGIAISDVVYRESLDGERWQLTFYGGNRWKLIPDADGAIQATEELVAFCSCYIWAGRFEDGSFVNVNFGVGQGKGNTLMEVCDKSEYIEQWKPDEMLGFEGIQRARAVFGDPWMEFFPGRL